jgi:hypothetical protein
LNQKIRTDLPAPVFKFNMEHDVWFGEANVRQPDTGKFHTWEVAGTSHVDHHLRQSREPLELRDIGRSAESAFAPTCGVPTVGTRVPVQYVLASAFDMLARWVEKGVAPPKGVPLNVTLGTPNVIARDEQGLPLGGIRLAEVAVPTALNMGTNTGPGACERWGYFKPFDIATLKKLYPSHEAYVSAVERVTNENLKAGFILKPDADFTISEARKSAIGRLDNIEAERDRPMADFDRAP